ncbi:ankyrin repeat domain-containing protein 31 [Pithys albifrons albifrons]|uniref:ankyrin repeat domain-containing protein 31 n=1 Tax=Pithys albifrons albifrons TaxID=3385563 RepID=UPI003A5CD101
MRAQGPGARRGHRGRGRGAGTRPGRERGAGRATRAGQRSGGTAMEQGDSGGHGGTDSDDTIVEGSVTESDVEEEEFRRRRLAFLNVDMALTTEMSITKGAPSPEICFMQKFNDHTYCKGKEQINPILQEAYTSDHSQSLLQGWIKCSSPTESISKPRFSLNAAVKEQQNYSVDIKLNGFQKDSEAKKLKNEELPPEINLCLDDPLEDITVLNEQTPEDTFPHVLDDCHRTYVTTVDTDNIVEEHSLNSDRDLSLTFMDVLIEQTIETDRFDSSALLRSPSDSESLKVMKPLPDMLECQRDAFSIDTSVAESSDALPGELVMPLHALSGSVVQPVTPIVPNERQFNAEGEQLNSEPSIPQLDDDCTQITSMMEPRLATIQVEEINAFMESDCQSTRNEQPVDDQQREKEVISDYWDATSSEKQTGERHSHLVEPATSAETAHTKSSQIQKSASKDKQDLETRKRREIILNEYTEAKQRRSQRINNKRRREAFGRNSVNLAYPLSLSTIHKRNEHGEDLLHSAVTHQDIDLVCKIIKAGGNVNSQDYAGLTALHIASVEGFYGIANLLLKAGADVNAAQKQKITPLQNAVKEDHYEMARLLLWYGADPLLKNKMGRSALEEASNPSMRKLLMSYIEKSKGYSESESTGKEDVILCGTSNSRSGTKKKIRRNKRGETQLHIAARRGDLSLVKTLLSSEICVNQQDYQGWTAIHKASSGGFTDVILELLEAGADVNSKSLQGVLPIHKAVSGNYLEAVRILLQHGANPCERDGSGRSALDQAYDEEMKELLKSYGAMDSVLPALTTEATERKSKHPCYDCCKNDDAALEPHEKYTVESVAALHDTEKKQKELLLFELRTSKDADMYIQKLSQIQDTLNEMLANQKTERDTLAKKYRASVESFKKEVLREQLINLASKQKSVLTIAQTQEKLVQKIQNYRKTKQIFSLSSSEKQISDLVIFHGNDIRPSLTADEIMCPDVVTLSLGLGASTPNGSRVGAHVSLENRFSAQECSQHPHICLDETVANNEAIKSKGASDYALVSANRVREYPLDNVSKLKNAAEVVTLPSEPTLSTAKTKCSQKKTIDCVVFADQGNKSLKPTSVTNTVNIVETRSTAVNKNVCQLASDCQQVTTHENLHSNVNKKEALQQQQVILLASTKNFPNTSQQMVLRSRKNSFNTNLVLTNLTSNSNSRVNVSEKSSQSYNNQEWENKQGRKNKKNPQLIDLLELGRIKPGENVLEFKLQEFGHKATLLKNGKIRTSKGQILQSPVLWVKNLLGRDTSVTWKYAWNKVTYLGTELSKFIVGGVSVSSDLELPTQGGKPLGKDFITRNTSNHSQHDHSPGTVSIAQPLGSFNLSNIHPNTPSLSQTEAGKTSLCARREASVAREFMSSSVQFNSVESHFLQFRKTVLVCKEEFLPCTVMEKHWNFYKGCEDFGF